MALPARTLLTRGRSKGLLSAWTFPVQGNKADLGLLYRFQNGCIRLDALEASLFACNVAATQASRAA